MELIFYTCFYWNFWINRQEISQLFNLKRKTSLGVVRKFKSIVENSLAVVKFQLIVFIICYKPQAI